MAFSFSPKIVTDGLVLALDAANPKSYVTGSSTWYDIINSSSSGSLTNGPIFNSTNGGSIQFDGVDDYVSCKTNITLSGTFSMDAFIYVTSRTNGDIMGSWNNPYQFLWRLDSNGNQVFAWNGGGPSKTVISSAVAEIGKWIYVAVTYDGTDFRFYNNDKLTDTISESVFNFNFVAMQVGANTYDATYFDGKIAYTKIYTKALSTNEIIRNYNALKPRFNIT